MIKTYSKNVEFIKVDNSKIINLSCIKWAKKVDECMEICTKGDGCYIGDTHKLCKINNPESYEKINKYFDSS
jgi:hypothetical protein